MQAPFHPSYAAARAAFLAAAESAGARLQSDTHPLPGRDGETLALDVAVLGDVHSPRRLLVSSGCHGVEGHCGSGVQIAALNDAELLAQAAAAGVTLVFAHALNPWGFSHRRRVTEDNVDLNRNCQDFGGALPANPAYAEFHPLLLPAAWPPDENNRAAFAALIAARGMAAAQAAVSGGQYDFADGLYYGGRAPTWSNRALRKMLREHCAGAAQLGWIDVHTGLGPQGHGERIFSQAGGNFLRASRWWDGRGRTPLTRADDGSSTSAVLTGTVEWTAASECPDTQLTMIALEFGTVPPLQVVEALRADQWLTRHPEAGREQHARIKQQLLDAFFVDTRDWQAAIVAQGLEVIEQAIIGLTQEPAAALPALRPAA